MTRPTSVHAPLTREVIFAQVREILVPFSLIPADEIELRHHLVNDLGFDSLDVIEAAIEIEEQFDITVPEGEETRQETVGAIVDGVASLLRIEG